jgi:ribonuclease PH
LHSSDFNVECTGIPLKELTATCSAGILQGQHILDLNQFEESTKCPRLFLSWQATLGKAAIVQMYSRLDPEQLAALMEMAVVGCEQVHNEMQSALAEKLKEMAVAAGGFEAD